MYVSAACVCMCLYVSVCVCMCLYVPVCVCMCLYVSVCVCMCLYVSVCVCMCLYVSVCVCMCLYVSVCVCMCMYVANRGLLVRLCPDSLCRSCRSSDDVTRASASALLLFSPVLQWVLSQRGQFEKPLWCWIARVSNCDNIQLSVAYTLFAPPTHGQLCRPRAKECPLKLIHYICSCSFIELWRAKVRSELQIYMAACYDLYQKIKVLFTCMLTRRSRCQALRFIRCGVASMESHSSM